MSMRLCCYSQLRIRLFNNPLTMKFVNTFSLYIRLTETNICWCGVISLSNLNACLRFGHKYLFWNYLKSPFPGATRLQRPWYAVDTSTVEWGARSRRFKFSRPDQNEPHNSEVFCLNPINVDIYRQLFSRQGDIGRLQLIALHFGTYQNRIINISFEIYISLITPNTEIYNDGA